MSTLLAVNDVLKVQTYCYAPESSQVGINVWWYRVKSLDAGATLEGMFLDLASQFATLYRAYLPSVARYSGGRVSRIVGAVAPSVISRVGNGVGSAPAFQMPDAMCAVVTKRVLRPGRAGLGRCYLPFIPQASCTPSGNLDPVSAPAISMLAIADFADTTTTFAGPDLFNVELEPGLPANVIYPWEAAYDYTLSLRLGTQHRRGDYGRMNPEGP